MLKISKWFKLIWILFQGFWMENMKMILLIIFYSVSYGCIKTISIDLGLLWSYMISWSFFCLIFFMIKHVLSRFSFIFYYIGQLIPFSLICLYIYNIFRKNWLQTYLTIKFQAHFLCCNLFKLSLWSSSLKLSNCKFTLPSARLVLYFIGIWLVN